MVMFLILESCQIYIDELHNRISQLEGGQAVSHPASAAVSPGPVAASTRPPLSHPAAASVAPPSSQPALAASNWPSVAAGSSRSIRPLATTEHQQVFGYMPRSDRGRSRACGSGRQPPAKKKTQSHLDQGICLPGQHCWWQDAINSILSQAKKGISWREEYDL